MNATLSINPYLVGNFAPVRSEDDFALEVTGEFPSDLQRRLLPQRAQSRSSSRGAITTGSPATA